MQPIKKPAGAGLSLLLVRYDVGDGVILSQRHYFAAVIRHHNSMLILCRQAAIFSFYCPAVFHGANAVIPSIDHGFNGERHTGCRTTPPSSAS